MHLYCDVVLLLSCTVCVLINGYSELIFDIHFCDSTRQFRCRRNFIVNSSTVIIGRILGFARPSVRLSVSPSVLCTGSLVNNEAWKTISFSSNDWYADLELKRSVIKNCEKMTRISLKHG